MPKKPSNLVNETVDQCNELAHIVATFQQNVDAASAAPASELAELALQGRDIVDAVDAVLDAIKQIQTRLIQVMVPEAFERENIKSFTTQAGHRVTVSMLVRASIKDQAAAFDWLRKNGYGDIIKPTVNASTLSGVAREILEGDGSNPDAPQDMPEDIFNVNAIPSTSIVRSKKS